MSRDIISVILSHLPLGDKISATQVCKDWHHLLWRQLHNFTSLENICKQGLKNMPVFNYYLQYYHDFIHDDYKLAWACRFGHVDLVGALLEQQTNTLKYEYYAGRSGSILLYEYLSRYPNVNYSLYMLGACEGGHLLLALKLMHKVIYYQHSLSNAIFAGHQDLVLHILRLLHKHSSRKDWHMLIVHIFYPTCLSQSLRILEYINQLPPDWFVQAVPSRQKDALYALFKGKPPNLEQIISFLEPYVYQPEHILLAAAHGGNLHYVKKYIAFYSEKHISKIIMAAVASDQDEVLSYILNNIPNNRRVELHINKISLSMYNQLEHLLSNDSPVIKYLLEQKLEDKSEIYRRMEKYSPLRCLDLFLEMGEPGIDVIWQRLESADDKLRGLKLMIQYDMDPEIYWNTLCNEYPENIDRFSLVLIQYSISSNRILRFLPYDRFAVECSTMLESANNVSQYLKYYIQNAIN